MKRRVLTNRSEESIMNKIILRSVKFLPVWLVVSSFVSVLQFCDSATAMEDVATGRWITRDPLEYGSGLAVLRLPTKPKMMRHMESVKRSMPSLAHGNVGNAQSAYLFEKSNSTVWTDPSGLEDLHLTIPINSILQNFPCGSVTVNQVNECTNGLTMQGSDCPAVDACELLGDTIDNNPNQVRNCPIFQKCCPQINLSQADTLITVNINLDFRPILDCVVSGTLTTRMNLSGMLGACRLLSCGDCPLLFP